MKIKTYGDKANPAFLFFAGSCTHPSWYLPSVYKLAERCFVVIPEYDGYCDDETHFTSIENTVDGVMAWLKANGIFRLVFAYRFSMGGSMVIYMLAHHLIEINHAVIDGA